MSILNNFSKLATSPFILFTLVFFSRDEYESDGSDGSDDDKPLTQTELFAKAMKSVKKREAAAKKEGFQYDLSDARERTKKKEKGKAK